MEILEQRVEPCCLPFPACDKVETLLSSTGGLLPAQMLGSDVAEWSKGKVWMPVHSVVLPMDRKTARLYQGKLAYPQASVEKVSSTCSQVCTPPFCLKFCGPGRCGTSQTTHCQPNDVWTACAFLVTLCALVWLQHAQ
eukprot:71000-Amphidinium_carterae.2